MRSGLIEVRRIPMKHTLKLFLVKEQQVVKTFLSNTPHEALDFALGSRSAIGVLATSIIRSQISQSMQTSA
jgi:hypothetical protein